MTISIQYNGIELTKYLDAVIDITRNVGQNRTPSLVKVGHTDGQRFQYTTASEGTITITAIIRNQKTERRRSLAQALMQSEPAKLIFSDEPGLYYLAITTGQQTLAEQFLHNTLTLSLIVPDGLAHSLTETSASGTSGATMTVTNAGSAPTAPVLTATMAADNGFVGWANDQGAVLQFGSPDEIDGVQHDDNQVAFHYDMLSAPIGVTMNNGVIEYPNYLGDATKKNLQAGTLDYNKLNADAATPVYARSKTDYWAGPSLSAPIKANSLGVRTGNFIWKNRINFSTGISQAGRAEFNLTSNGKLIMALILHDSYYTADSLIIDGVYNNATIFSENLNRKTFKNGFYELTISKLGSQITYSMAGVQSIDANGVHQNNAIMTKAFTMDDAPNLAVDSFTAWLSGFSNSDGWGINWSDSLFEWVNVDYWQDMPNRFKAGDVVSADVATKTISVNGVEDPTLQTVGNMWDSFMLSPGSNDIQLVVSSWADPAKATIQYREAWY